MERKLISRLKITKTALEGLPNTRAGEHIMYDTELQGFCVRIGKKSKSFCAEGTVKGLKLSRRITIGRFGILTVEEARAIARGLLGDMARGIDPVFEKEKRAAAHEAEVRRFAAEAEEAKRRAITLKDLWEAYKIDRQGTRATNTMTHYGSYVHTAFGGKRIEREGEEPFQYEDWLGRPLESITESDCFDYHRKLKDRPYYANGALRTLSTLFAYAMKRKWVKANPVGVLKGEWYPEEQRETTIPESKLGAWFKAVDAVRTGNAEESVKASCDYLELLLLTGARREEGACLRWEQVNLAEKTITFLDTKNGTNHTLPIADYTMTLLERRKQAADAIGSPWAFPSFNRRKGKDGHIVDTSWTRREVIEKVGMHFSLHDLRRTFITLASSRVSYPILKMLVNHSTKGDVTLGYIKPSPEEKVKRLREPVDQIAAFLISKKAEGQGMRLAVTA